jgi:hypothetical protein
MRLLQFRCHQRITLSRALRFAIGQEDRGLDDREVRFVVETGRFGVIVGTSSEGGLVATFDVVGP